MKLILTFIGDPKKTGFKKGFSIACEKYNKPIKHNGKEYSGAYLFKDISGRSKYVAMPFEFEGIEYTIREEPQTD